MTDVQPGTPATSDDHLYEAAFNAFSEGASAADGLRRAVAALRVLHDADRALIEAEARADERRKIADAMREHAGKLSDRNPARPAFLVIADKITRGDL